MAVQTRSFSLAFLRAAHQRAEQEGWVVTDDASLLELCGHAVHVAEEKRETKITTPEDLEMLRMTGERIPCVGYGYDVHRAC
ncbi:MAG: 2-C-methyl-D-erythritol 4-phosphate cytidylyltransferase [Bilophila wadsworthia]